MKNGSFQKKMAQLEELINWFESDEVELEVAVKKYEQALALCKELEDHLKTAKNEVEVINKKFST